MGATVQTLRTLINVKTRAFGAIEVPTGTATLVTAVCISTKLITGIIPAQTLVVIGTLVVVFHRKSIKATTLKMEPSVHTNLVAVVCPNGALINWVFDAHFSVDVVGVFRWARCIGLLLGLCCLGISNVCQLMRF